ncbi:reverse transcriptase domain-containing protein [Tanacetum coccineum]
MVRRQQDGLKASIGCFRKISGKSNRRVRPHGTPIKRRGLKERLRPRHVRSRSESLEPRRDRPESLKKKGPERKAVFKRLEKGVFYMLRDKGKSVSVHLDDSRRRLHHSSRRDTESCHQNSRSRATESASERRYTKRASSRRTEELSESEGSAGGHWKSKLKRQKSSIEDDLSHPWSAAKTERWAMPTWCHMFNSTLTGNARVWFDDLPKEKTNSYDELKKSFLENYLQQKKCIKDPVEIHNIRQRDGESTEEFVRSGEIIWPIGQIQLLVKIGDEERSASAWMNFMVVRSSSLYNGIIERPGVKKLQAVSSTAHGMLKILVEGGVITLKCSKLVPLECAVVSEPKEAPLASKPMIEERIKVAINPKYPEQTVMIGSTLTEEGRNKLCGLLQRNLDIFSWKPADMTGVPRHIAEHRLNVRERCSSVRQKKRGQAADRNQAIQEEVGKLVEAGIMKEVHYHDWLSNPVMVKNHDDSWRMCVDFKDQNRACPKDGYPLPKIDWKVESLCGFPFKCFLDAYKGYHRIQMAKENEEKTAFITSQGIFCYTKMPFGLRNAGATYQRLVDKAFHKQIGRNLEVYVDDLVIKSRTEDETVRDIEETFKTLREINMKLNPKKCTFGVEEGMFLGYKVNSKGLKVCPDKVDAVLSLPSPKILKDVQKLNGKLASLNRFLAKSAEKSLPFFKTLKKCTKKSDFHWTTEAEEAFKKMKQLIAELRMLTTPMEKEELIVYLAAAKETVSAILMTEKEAKQMPIYFVSRALRGPELNYTSMEKLVLALIHASKRLKRYFQAHPIIVITDQPIQQILTRPEVAGRLQKWIERPEEDSLDTPMEEEEELSKPWILFTDGSSCMDGSGA